MSDETQVQEQAPVQEQATIQKGKQKSSGNLIHDVAVEIEQLTKTKALNQAEKLAEDIEANYFKLGGILKLIQSQQWYEGFPSFDAFVLEKFGFAVRKAHYLVSIYTNLVDKQIPWDKVSGLGWTKLKDLAPILTQENLESWIEKASSCTVLELQALIKAAQGGDGEAASSKTTSDSVTLKFKVHNDQSEVIQSALAKAKGELSTDFDNVALAGICTGYLSNASGVSGGGEVDMEATFKKMGYEEILGIFEKVFPLIDMTIDVEKHEAAQAKAA